MTRIALLSRPGLLAAGAVVVIAGIAGFTLMPRGIPVPEPVPEPVALAVGAAEPAPASQATAERQDPSGPRLSLVTVAPDGLSQVAGFADPGAAVEILLDGAVVGRAEPGTDGAFYVDLALPASDQARALTLRSVEDGKETQSQDIVLIQPVTGAPPTLEVAEAATKAPAAAEAASAEPTPAPDTFAETATETATATATETATETAAPSSAPALIRTTPDGVEVAQPAIPAGTPPEVMASVALDAIAYSASGDVQLTGRSGGAADGFVRVYLDNRAVITLPIAADGSWRTDLPEVDSGVYTLRVDQLDPQGVVTSRVETPFKREDPAELAADVEIAQAITVQPGSTLWAIARDRYGEGTLYLRVFEANRDRIRNPDLIYPGQVFDLP